MNKVHFSSKSDEWETPKFQKKYNMKLLSRSKGEIAMLKVQLKAHEKNLVCSLPSNNELYYDLIIDNPQNARGLQRVQVKYCNRKHGNNIELMLGNPRSKRIHYLKSDVNTILVYLVSKDIVLKYDQKHFHRKKQLQINLNNSKSKWFYKKFIW